MITILSQDPIVSMFIGEQEKDDTLKYRIINYSHCLEVNDGYLIYNFLTKEMIFCDKLDYCDEKLIKKFFLVPIDYNEEELLYKIQDVLKHSYWCNDLNYCKIMTTTDCNARCFYCFEKGIDRFNMSTQTAEDVANFIIKKSSDVRISWFGGEPLYNEEVIDIISQKLLENNVKFSSDMITNGYLFNSVNILKAKKTWRLNKVQITLDGTEKVYNKTKNYIYENINAYNVVLNNIEELLNANIKVTIRLNMDLYNAEDLFKLIEILAKRYGTYKNFDCYIQPLFEGCGSHISGRTLDAREFINEKYYKLYEYARKLDIYRKSKLPRKLKVFACMADTPGSLAVYPDGKLWKCDHFSSGEDIGSIYSDNYNNEIVDSWKKIRFYKGCNECKFFPECLIPQKCLEVLPGCYKSDILVKTKILEDSMLDVYEAYKNNN